MSEHSKITDSEAQEMLRKLKEHYGERVAPVSEYCQAFYDWMEVAGPYLKETYPDLYAQLPTLRLVVTKSAALVRFVYLGERPRTVPCPIHKGKWSGILYPKEWVRPEMDPEWVKHATCKCGETDGNLCGWLRDDQQS